MNTKETNPENVKILEVRNWCKNIIDNYHPNDNIHPCMRYPTIERHIISTLQKVINKIDSII
jgi:hypothetical protein